MVERPSPAAVSPSVVAVLVTHDPGAWFDGTLAALAAQDHPILHVLVIDAGSADDPTDRVHAVLPHASVVRVDASPGFGAAANDVLELAPDADYFLFCHDDAAPEAGAVRKLVATAQRWEAGVVGPKLVRWDDPRRLLQVGEAVDKTGATMSMVDRGELDQGQHDGLREVFSVPGAFTLVRSDLFLRVGGFDEVIAFVGENLSLCWRARIAGARVVVTTDVRVRHREGLRERFPPALRRRLAARNRLRVMLTCYGRWHLLRVLPQAALASLVEAVSSLVTGRLGHARAAVGAWWWNLRQLCSLRAARRQVRRFRTVDDKAVRSLQVPGLLRPQLVLHRLAARQDEALDDVPASLPSTLAAPSSTPAGSGSATAPSGSNGVPGAVGAGGPVGAATSAAGTLAGASNGGSGAAAGDEHGMDAASGGVPAGAGTARAGLTSASLDSGSGGGAEVDGGAPGGELGPVGAATAAGAAARRLRTGWTSGAAIVLLLLAGTLLLGSRHLISRGVPVVGDLAPLDSPGRLFADWSGGWRRIGLGSDAPAPTAFGFLSGLGALASGKMAALRLLLTVGLIPVGVLGAFRLLQPTGSRRAAAGAAVAYALLPLPYGALDDGRWAPLAVYAAAPWMLVGLARAGDLAPLGLRRRPRRRDDESGDDRPGTEIDLRTGARAMDTTTGADVPAGRSGSESLLLHVLALGVVTALLAMVVPAAPVVLLVMAVALVVGSVLAFEPRGVLRVGRAALGGALVAIALHLPWSWDLLRSWRQVEWGSPIGAGRGSIDPLDVLRRADGLSGTGTLAWALLPAAGAVLLVGRDWRLGWAIRGWVLALVAWAAAWASWHRALDLPWPSPDVLLTLGGLGLAVAIGAGVAAIEVDVAGRSRRLGLRRMVTAVGTVAFVVAGVPLVAASFDGYWQMPRGDFSRVLDFVDEEAASTAPRLLWIGDPDVLPLPGRPLAKAGDAAVGDAEAVARAVDDVAGAEVGDMAYAASEGLPRVRDLWPGGPDAATTRVGEAIDLALDQQTTRLGRLLAPMAVEYVVVPQRLAPSPFTGDEQAAAPELLAALAGQLDLERVDVDSAVIIYRNTAFVPGRAVVDDPEELDADGPRELRTLDLAEAAEPALRDGDDDGVAVGELDDDVTLYQSTAASSHWVLEVDGERISPRRAFGWANAYEVDEGGRAELRYETPVSRRVVLGLQVGLWLAVLWLIVHLRRRRGPGASARGDGRPSVHESVSVIPVDGPEPEGDAEDGAERPAPAPAPALVSGGPGASDEGAA